MSKTHDNPLDRLLKDWARSREAGAEDLASLRRRIREEMAAGPLTTSPMQLRTPRSASRNRRFAVAALGMAATLFIALAGWWGFLRPDGPWNGIVRSTEHPVVPTSPARAERMRLLAEYQAVFGSQFAWFVEQSNRAEIGLRSPDSQQPAGPREYVAIRLMLFARPASGDEWQEVQTLNVVARREEFVEVFSGAENGAPLTMWAYPLDEEMISIDLRYEPSKFAGHSGVPTDITIESSSVQALGESAPIYSFERDGIEYRLYQSADLLAGKDVG